MSLTLAWYQARRPGLGDEFAEEISATYAAIEEHPLRFPLVLDDIRMAVIHRFPYLIYFVTIPTGRSVLLCCTAIAIGRSGNVVAEEQRALQQDERFADCALRSLLSDSLAADFGR
jgi:hypothetical protein